MRRVREAEEAGRRQAQEELRQRQDEHYHDTQHALQQHTAAHHTRHILQRAVAVHVEQQQQQWQAVVASQGAINDESEIAELLQSVVWPEVELRVARASVDGRRFLKAAHCSTRGAVCQQAARQYQWT